VVSVGTGNKSVDQLCRIPTVCQERAEVDPDQKWLSAQGLAKRLALDGRTEIGELPMHPPFRSLPIRDRVSGAEHGLVEELVEVVRTGHGMCVDVSAKGDHDGADIFGRLLFVLCRGQGRSDQHESHEKYGV
jgi:hypothetical protein